MQTDPTHVEKTYKNGRKALQTLSLEPSADNFHEFRKQTEELAADLSILRPLHPATFDPLADKLKILAEHLGQANDPASPKDRPVTLHGARLERMER